VRDLILRGAVALLSGPGGLASRLRTGTLTGPAGSISLPLDVGTATDTIPPHLRRAVWLRDVHCGFPGCESRDCQVHHTIPLAEGGATRLSDLVLGCSFHHLIAVHEWGWKLIVNADGTKTAISPDGRRVLHSHGPPHAA
jgi:HNH endonuclease